MAKIERFEDLKSWQKARALANMVYALARNPNFSRDFQLRGQIQGAAGSVMHNIAEGFDAGADAEFIRFLKYARRSASEVQSQLYLALDQGYIVQADMQKAYGLATEAKRLINGLIAYLRGNHQLRELSSEYQLDNTLFETDPLDEALTDDHPPTNYPTNDYPTIDYPTTDYPTTDYPTTAYPTTDYPTTDYQTTDY